MELSDFVAQARIGTGQLLDSSRAYQRVHWSLLMLFSSFLQFISYLDFTKSLHYDMRHCPAQFWQHFLDADYTSHNVIAYVGSTALVSYIQRYNVQHNINF